MRSWKFICRQAGRRTGETYGDVDVNTEGCTRGLSWIERILGRVVLQKGR